MRSNSTSFVAERSANPSSVSSWSVVTRKRSAGSRRVAEVEELIDDRRPESLDVHRATRREMEQQLATLRGTQRVEAAPHHLSLLADELRVARRAVLGHLPRLGALRALLEDDPDDLGDDVAGLVQQHGVADAHVLACDLVLVVQRAAAHRRAGDERRLEHGDRRHRAGASHLHVDVEHLRSRAPPAGTCTRSPSAVRARSCPSSACSASDATLMTTPSVS